MSVRSHQLAGGRLGTRGMILLLALVALACGPAPAPEPAPLVDTVELILGFDEPVYLAGDPTAVSVTSVLLPPGESPGVFDGVLDIEDATGSASELHLHVQVE
jgi:hypothetical protein